MQPTSEQNKVNLPNLETLGFDEFGNPKLPARVDTMGQTVGGPLVGGDTSAEAVPMPGVFTLGDANETPGQLHLAIADGKGDTYIAAGKTDFTNVESGFILGIDDSDSNIVKFYIGNATNYLNWDGTNIIINGLTASITVGATASRAKLWRRESNGDINLSFIQGSDDIADARGGISMDATGMVLIYGNTLESIAPISGDALVLYGNKLETAGFGPNMPVIGSQGSNLTIDAAKLYLPEIVLPTTAVNIVTGQLYYIAATNQILVYNGTAWKQVTLT